MTPYDVGCRRGSFTITRMKIKYIDPQFDVSRPVSQRCGLQYRPRLPFRRANVRFCPFEFMLKSRLVTASHT